MSPSLAEVRTYSKATITDVDLPFKSLWSVHLTPSYWILVIFKNFFELLEIILF